VNVYWISAPWTGKLAIIPRPRGGEWLADDVRQLADSGLNVVVSLLTESEASELGLTDERQLLADQGIQFLQFPIADLDVPTAGEAALDFLSKVIALLERGQNVAIHCRQSVGRSGMIAASLLIMEGTDPEMALETVSKARGLAVPETPAQREWIINFPRRLVPAL